MIILLGFAFLSGLITIAAPCIWPLLPIILSSTTTGGKRKPLGITLGIVTSFTLFTLTLSYILSVIPISQESLRIFAVIVIGLLGITLVVPTFSAMLEGAVSRLTAKLTRTSTRQPSTSEEETAKSTGFGGGYLTGFALGLVWSPCAGPILATIATLASQQGDMASDSHNGCVCYWRGCAIAPLCHTRENTFHQESYSQ
jgi:cytochrome c biogenesis protein CcdA